MSWLIWYIYPGDQPWREALKHVWGDSSISVNVTIYIICLTLFAQGGGQTSCYAFPQLQVRVQTCRKPWLFSIISLTKGSTLYHPYNHLVLSKKKLSSSEVLEYQNIKLGRTSFWPTKSFTRCFNECFTSSCNICSRRRKRWWKGWKALALSAHATSVFLPHSISYFWAGWQNLCETYLPKHWNESPICLNITTGIYLPKHGNITMCLP